MCCVLMDMLFDVCARAHVEAKVEELLAAGAWAISGIHSSRLFSPKPQYISTKHDLLPPYSPDALLARENA